MQLTTKYIKKIIKEELDKLLIESKLQRTLGLGHSFSAEELIDSMESWVEKNVFRSGRGYYYTDENGEERLFSDSGGLGKLFYSALTNQTSGAKAHDHETFGTRHTKRTDLYNRYVKMKKMIDNTYKYGAGLKDILRKADPTGEKQKAGARPEDISSIYASSLPKNDPFNKMNIMKRYYKK